MGLHLTSVWVCLFMSGFVCVFCMSAYLCVYVYLCVFACSCTILYFFICDIFQGNEPHTSRKMNGDSREYIRCHAHVDNGLHLVYSSRFRRLLELLLNTRISVIGTERLALV